MKKLFIKKVQIVVLFLFALNLTTNAQIKYRPDGKVTIGATEPYQYYHTTLAATGMYFKCKTSNFFQIDVTPYATRLASHDDQVVFYNSQTSTFNSIQVRSVYNSSDARAKTNIQTLNNGLETISRLRPVVYNFKDDYLAKFSSDNTKEIGLLAQEVEQVLPNCVVTDEEGNKLINYISIIPVLIDAIQTLQAELDELRSGR